MAPPAAQDAYGLFLAHALAGAAPVEIVERDDGFVGANPAAAAFYLSPFRRWPAFDRRALRFVRGRVLDVGAGAGRAGRHLQERGHDVVAIDVSPGAVDVCRRRGVRDARVLGLAQVGRDLGRFDTVVMTGNNFGLLEGRSRARTHLRRLARIADRIVATTTDPYATEDELHLAYHRRNLERGRMAGELRIRVRFRERATPWFDYLLASRAEVAELVEGTSWRVAHLADDEPHYGVVLDRG